MGEQKNEIDPKKAFEAIALILSNRGDGIKVRLKEIKKKPVREGKKYES